MKFEKVPYGDYEVVEVSTIENYALDSTPISVEVREDKATIEKTKENVKKKPNVELVKADKDDPNKILPEVEFELKQDGKTMYKATTNDKGIAVFKDVIYGEYQLVETNTLKEHVLNSEPISLSVSEDKNTVKVQDLKPVLNSKKKETILVEKIDKSKKTPIKEVEFELRQMVDVEIKVIGKKSDDKRQLSFEKVEYGDYEFVETKAASGYVKNSLPIKVSIRNDGEVVKTVVENQIYHRNRGGGISTLDREREKSKEENKEDPQKETKKPDNNDSNKDDKKQDSKTDNKQALKPIEKVATSVNNTNNTNNNTQSNNVSNNTLARTGEKENKLFYHIGFVMIEIGMLCFTF